MSNDIEVEVDGRHMKTVAVAAVVIVAITALLVLADFARRAYGMKQSVECVRAGGSWMSGECRGTP